MHCWGDRGGGSILTVHQGILAWILSTSLSRSGSNRPPGDGHLCEGQTCQAALRVAGWWCACSRGCPAGSAWPAVSGYSCCWSNACSWARRLRAAGCPLLEAGKASDDLKPVSGSWPCPSLGFLLSCIHGGASEDVASDSAATVVPARECFWRQDACLAPTLASQLSWNFHEG